MLKSLCIELLETRNRRKRLIKEQNNNDAGLTGYKVFAALNQIIIHGVIGFGLAFAI